jgi:arylsulfatase A-like enzyme
LAWIDRRDADSPRADAPWFAYLHVMEPHLPYDPPPPFRGTFADPAYAGPDLDRPPPYLGFLPFERGDPLPEPERRHLVDRYDEEILCWDAAYGTLLAGLAERGLDDETIVVTLSDHGEEFYEHGGWTHGHSLHDELLRVPLFIRAPGLAGRRVDWPVRTTDLFPTILGLAGVMPRSFPPFGRDLHAALVADREPPIPVVAEVRIGGAGGRSIVDGGWKYIVATHGNDSVELLFDLARDPGEQNSLPGPFGELRARLDAVGRLAGAMALRAASREITDEERKRLEALNYFGD